MWLPWQQGALGRLWAMKGQGQIGKHGKPSCQEVRGSLDSMGKAKKPRMRFFYPECEGKSESQISHTLE